MTMISAAVSLVARHLRPHFVATCACTRSVSSAAGPLELVSSKELERLNKTSVALYRLLLRESRAVQSRPVEKQHTEALRGRVLLQPPVNPGEPGRIRELEGMPTLLGEPSSSSTDDDDDDEQANTSNDEHEDMTAWNIIAFFHRQSDAKSGVNLEVQLSHIPSICEYLIPNKESINPHQYHLVTPEDLIHAVRSSFLRIHDTCSSMPESLREDMKQNLTKDDILLLQRRAIDAISILNEQLNLTDTTSIGENKERGIRVIATSKFKAKGFLSRGAGLGTQEEHVFVYRIRIENVNKSEEAVTGNEDIGDSQEAIQLLGRKWKITDPHGAKDDDDDGDEGDVQIVDAPMTGVVGYHPVLKPGDSFEYMSGCNIMSPVGFMEGCYYMAAVDSNVTTSRVGDAVEAFDIPEDDSRLFEVPVETFLMDANK